MPRRRLRRARSHTRLLDRLHQPGAPRSPRSSCRRPRPPCTQRRPCQDSINEHLQGIVRGPPGSVPEPAVHHVGLEDRLERHPHCCCGSTRSRTEGNRNSARRPPCPASGINTRRDGHSGRYCPSPSSAASSPRSRVVPYSSGIRQRDTVNAQPRRGCGARPPTPCPAHPCGGLCRTAHGTVCSGQPWAAR